MANLYNEKSIESLSPLEFTRLRPQVYAGDCTYSTQLLVEIVSNAIDEFRLGHGNLIEVFIDKDIITVRDYGQGFIPNSYRDDGKTILEAAFSVLNTSTFLSHWLRVSTWRDNKNETIWFKEGEFERRESGTNIAPGAGLGKPVNGTEVVWQPSEEFFTNTTVEIESIKKLFKTTASLCPGLTIDLFNGDIAHHTGTTDV